MKKIILIIMDGLGDRPNKELDGLTALQAANRPNLNYLSSHGTTGLMSPVASGIRAGSDTSHLSILGYDPHKYYTGRGPFEALGVGLELKPGDIAFRANYASIIDGKIVDRRAGRIQNTAELSSALETEIDGVKFIVKSGVEHRAAVVMRGPNLSDKVSETDPHSVDSSPMDTEPLAPEANFTSAVINKFLERSRKILASHPLNRKLISEGKLPANEIMLRGVGKMPAIPSFHEKYGMKAACISGTPLIRGIAGLAGFDVLSVEGMNGRVDTNYENIISSAIKSLEKYDFILINFKGTDIAGHDRKPWLKKQVIESVDSVIAPLLKLLQDTLIVVTGDHSTPCSFGDHTGDPVPIMFATDGIINDNVRTFDELSVSDGYYKITSGDIMPIILSYSDRSEKYGA
ncbi:2,3-bisphosphoglycerate-independent phosphoglycerate mutase [Ferroplasma acidiphilum]|jgi:2,3-bisphosphoglycerate-independent phosphoglycerate mutase|uniref:2,3-bisphosphoglycerate-independent phosphoglycerate mutase n=1 Tax=Ferroplasma acidiphilum TaxID=74969 RepID=A0A7K4FLN6_9ARCH|nr:2,3-bisphosphoglycerate-independent phosphoglycerate mutase [Ferroplasma acidiphilum]MCL4349584.1 2,3-bisphosphoglycerate-independent phosphoglycerate mutase [Candidatus Thermoplasmatota archaeon]NOL59960.1 2,3-bisphosphoglycerate-independent phosphoglycerate mutase [Ferroplasma acidiphilum]WMT53271.1 MAG: 2,3-bisphosphoglycerate-independent phosphoglycerate mutase [Ferroplasma acidiphilum]